MTPNDRKYTKEHEWLLIEGNVAKIGITDHAQDALGEQRFDRVLQIPAQGSCAELRVVGRVDDEGLGGGRQLARELLVGKALVERGDLQVDDAGDVLLRERLIEHDLVEPVEEFGAEAAAQERLHFVFRFL